MSGVKNLIQQKTGGTEVVTNEALAAEATGPTATEAKSE